jgi:hypothetical protein
MVLINNALRSPSADFRLMSPLSTIGSIILLRIDYLTCIVSAIFGSTIRLTNELFGVEKKVEPGLTIH